MKRFTDARQALSSGQLGLFLLTTVTAASVGTKIGIAGLAFIFLVFAFVGLRTLAAPGPEQAPKALIEAAATQDGAKFIDSVCERDKDQVRRALMVPGALLAAGQYFLGGAAQIKVDTSHLSYTVLSNDGARARVRVQGIVGSSAGLAVGSTQTVDTVVPVVKEHNQWLVCDS
jgi:hypothetical protein